MNSVISPIYIDNQNNKAWLVNETAPIAYLPILRPMFSLMREHGIRLHPIWIKSDSNLLADYASRGALDLLMPMLPNWHEHVKDLQRYIPLKHYAKPGPLFLFKNGYVDGRDVPDARTDKFADTHV